MDKETALKSVTIDGQEYQPVKRGGYHAIVILDRGFVVYGRVTLDRSYVTIEDVACIRRWGTTKGLGQLAYDGPTEQTQLDPQPTTRVHELQVVQIIECKGTPWTL